MDRMEVPFNKPGLTGHEFEYMRDAVARMHLAGDGYYTKRCHALLEEKLGTAKALLTTSCTHALEMAALLLQIQPSDQVIVPSFTFVSTINAFVLRGAEPIFADIRPDTLNIDESALPTLITSNTRAILAVHYAGVGCEMDVIKRTAEQHQLAIVEDNAHGLFGKFKGQYLGTFGEMATQSFHETKNFHSGEGGALLINDSRFCDRAEIIREKGTNRSRFFRGEVDKYSWVDIGSSYLPSDILAAFLLAQLQSQDEIQSKRQHIWDYYNQHLQGWAKDYGVQLPQIPPYCEQTYHMFYMILPSLDQRQDFIQYLKRNGINSVFHYLPLHLSDMGRRYGGKQGDCPVTEDISDRLVRLPFFHELPQDALDYTVETILKYRI